MNRAKSVLESVSQKTPCFGGKAAVELVVRSLCETTQGAFLLAAKLAGYYEEDNKFLENIAEHLPNLDPAFNAQVANILRTV